MGSATARNQENRPKDQERNGGQKTRVLQGSRGQWEELIPVASVFALQGFLAPYAERVQIPKDSSCTRFRAA
jgi:hypothetical protein